MNEFFFDQTQEQIDQLVESPMFRYECCKHCTRSDCPQHDGHPVPCEHGCEAGTKMIGEP